MLAEGKTVNPLRRLIRFHVPSRETVLWVLLAGLSWLYILCGCTTTQPVRYECPQRLTEQWQFTYCMTGPFPWGVEATAEWCRWCCGEPVDVQRIVQRLARLALPVPCRVFDTDGDNDVDLRDFREMQNER